MPADEDDDLYDEEFDFVDDDDDADDAADDGSETEDSEIDDGSPTEVVAEEVTKVVDEPPTDAPDNSEVVEEVAEEPKVPTDHVVHIYESQQFHRTIDRPFTAEDAEAFASDYNRAGKAYARFAVAGKGGVKPKKTIERGTTSMADDR